MHSGVLRDRSGRWFSTMISGLLAADTRIARRLAPPETAPPPAPTTEAPQEY